MKFKGEPKKLVRITKIRPHLIRKVPKSIRFDKDGEFETNNPYLIKRLLTKFEQVKEITNAETQTEEEKNTEKEKVLTYNELQVMYSEKTGKTAVGVKKSTLLKELGV